MNTEHVCLVRSKNQIETAIQYFPKPHKTLILGQNVKRKSKSKGKNTQTYHNRIYVVSSLSKFVEKYPLEVNNHLHEVIPANRLVKPYVEVEFFNFNVNDTNITESKSRFRNILITYGNYLHKRTYMEKCEIGDWTIMETQTIKDGGLNSHFIGILNNGYYFKNNEIQRRMVATMLQECQHSSGVNMNAYDNMYQLLLCDQTHTGDTSHGDTANTLKCVWGDNAHYDLLFVLRYHRIWDEEYIIEKRKIIKRLRRDQIKRRRPKTTRDTTRGTPRDIKNENID